jgi:L-ascorbate metabolism protein UlaG (beta-lactamase superfamily)
MDRNHGMAYKTLILTVMAAAGAMIFLPAGRTERHATQDTSSLSLEEIASQKIHHGDGAFLNPFAKSPMHRRNLMEILRWKFLTKNRFEEDYARERVVPVHIDWKALEQHHSVSVTWITHASVHIRENGSSLIVDPVLGGMFWPIQDFTPLAFPPSDIPPVDAVLVTHGHYDHLDIDSLKHFNGRARYLVPLGHAGLLREHGMTRVQEMDWMDTARAGSFEITFLPANHWTMRNPFTGPNTALWGGFLVKTASGKTIYISGDTAYFDRFREIGAMGPIDLAVINLGAYEPRWFMKKSHMNPGETVKAFRELGAKKLMVVHWGTFRLGDEPVFQPFLDIRQEMASAGLSERLVELKHGQTYSLD